MRTPLVAANWKMNDLPAGFGSLDSPYRARPGVDVVVLPTHLDCSLCISADLATGAQCGRPEPTGAFTGDVSMAMLKEIGCRYVLCGHSDRRKFHGEKDEDIAAQAKAALAVGLIPIVCVGETEEEREQHREKEVIERQLQHINPLCAQRKTQDAPLVIAYEPVWAIGTGKTALPKDAEEMHAFIRSLLPADRQDTMRLLYGGSAKPENAPELIEQLDIDGFLVGGASLDPVAFKAIINACVA